MSCKKCGTEINQDAELCEMCNSNKSRPLIIIWAALAVILLIIAIVVGAFGDFSGIGDYTPDEYEEESQAREILTEAFANLADEFEARLDGSPFIALGMLADVLDSGTITAEFTHRNREMLFGGTTRGSATILADGQNNNYAIEAAIGLMGGLMNIDLEMHINEERAAIRTGLTGSAFYGITYSTFEDDIQRFGRGIGMEEQTMEQMAGWVRGAEMFLNVPSFREVSWPNFDALLDFLLELEYEHVIDAVDDFHWIIFRLNEYDMAILINSLDSLIGLQERSLLLERLTSLEIWSTVSPEGRLLWMGAYLHMEIDDRLHVFQVGLNFGTSKFDQWALTLRQQYTREAQQSENFPFPIILLDPNEILWDIDSNSQEYAHTFRIYLDRYTDISALRTVWQPDDGRFELSFDESSVTRSFTGTFTPKEEGGFNVILDTIDLSPTTALDLQIEATPGVVHIQPIDFINLDQWSPALMDTIGFVLDLIS